MRRHGGRRGGPPVTMQPAAADRDARWPVEGGRACLHLRNATLTKARDNRSRGHGPIDYTAADPIGGPGTAAPTCGPDAGARRMATVRLEHVWKRFDNDVIAVRDVSFEARDGEFLVLVGPSGCGKSTCLRMVAGLEEISGGSIYLDERRINDVPARDRDIAMVFQNYAL